MKSLTRSQVKKIPLHARTSVVGLLAFHPDNDVQDWEEDLRRYSAYRSSGENLAGWGVTVGPLHTGQVSERVYVPSDLQTRIRPFMRLFLFFLS